jgi:hypothetical protein
MYPIHSPAPPHFALFLAASASLLVASSNNAVSTAPLGKWTYRTTDPRINMSFVEHCNALYQPSCPLLPFLRYSQRTKCGHRISSTASALSSLMLRYWSTLLRVPRIWTSFLSSTVISCSTSVLKKLVVPWSQRAAIAARGRRGAGPEEEHCVCEIVCGGAGVR